MLTVLCALHCGGLSVKKKLSIDVEINLFGCTLVKTRLEVTCCTSYSCLLFFCKFHCHKKKWLESKPTFPHFVNEFTQYSTILTNVLKKAIKTLTLNEYDMLHEMTSGTVNMCFCLTLCYFWFYL